MSPYTTFTSYRRDDSDAVDLLEQQMRLRGVRSWRDVRNIPHGAATTEQITRGIREETDGFLAFATEIYLERRRDRGDVVWEVELPEGAARWKRGDYPLTPFLSGTRSGSLKDRCAEEGLPDLSQANGGRVPLGATTPEEHASAYQDEARAQLRNALAGTGGRVVAAFRSFQMASLPAGAQLDIDWTKEIDRGSPELWESDLLPALDDIHDALGAAAVRRLELHVLTRLNAALSFGMKLPLATGIEIVPFGRDGEEWDPRAAAGDAAPLREDSSQRDGNSGEAVLELSIVRDMGRDAADLAHRIGAGHHVRLATPGMDRSMDPRPVAGAIATQIGDVARWLHSSGVTDLHVLLASPAPLAVLIGRQLHALGRIHAYFREESGQLRRAFTAGA